MIERLGAGPWKIGYSLASHAGFLLVPSGYGAAPAGPFVPDAAGALAAAR